MKKSIRDYMTLAPFTIDREEPLANAQRLMSERKVRHVPVTTSGALSGVLTQNDLHLALLKNNYVSAGLTVGDAVNQEALVVDPLSSLEEVMRKLTDGRHPCAVVIEGGKVRGIFTTVDALRIPKKLAES